MDLERLKDPFRPDEIDWRVGQCGKNGERVWARVLAYLTSRAVMERLDEVCGPENWWDEYRPGPQGGVVCGITIRTDAGPVTKWDGAENTDIEGVKGGLSDAFKRAAVKFGVGRYLYGLGESWADCTTERQKGDGWHSGATKDGTRFWWKAPGLPREFLPRESKPDPAPAPRPDTRKQQVNAAAKAAGLPPLKPASELPPRTNPLTGGDAEDWTQEPPNVASGENPAWYCVALKGLLHRAGAGTPAKAKTIFAWLSPGEVVTTDDAKRIIGNSAESKGWWQVLMEKSAEVPFERMWHEATEHQREVAPT